MAPVSALTGRRRWHVGTAVAILTVPMSVAAVVASGLSVPLGTVIQQSRQVPVTPPDTLAGITVGAVALALAAGVGAGVVTARTAASWRPGQE